MGNTTNNRQRKFRQAMKDEGKTQRSFFLTDKALEAIQQHKEKIQASSINHALEHILTSLIVDVVAENEILKGRQDAIIAQAKRVADAYRKKEQTYAGEDGVAWGTESRNLALLIDPSRPIAKRPLPK